MSKYGKKCPDELMSNKYVGLSIGKYFFAFSSKEAFPEYIVVPCYECYNSYQMSVSSLKYPALSYAVTELVDSRTKPIISDELFLVFQAPYNYHFSQEVGASGVRRKKGGFP